MYVYFRHMWKCTEDTAPAQHPFPSAEPSKIRIDFLIRRKANSWLEREILQRVHYDDANGDEEKARINLKRSIIVSRQ